MWGLGTRDVTEITNVHNFWTTQWISMSNKGNYQISFLMLKKQIYYDRQNVQV
jgi:hypothetical protein